MIRAVERRELQAPNFDRVLEQKQVVRSHPDAERTRAEQAMDVHLNAVEFHGHRLPKPCVESRSELVAVSRGTLTCEEVHDMVDGIPLDQHVDVAKRPLGGCASH